MALQPVEQYATNTQTRALRADAKRIRAHSFAAGSGTLAKLQPVSRNDSTGFWAAWGGVVSQVESITKAGTVSGGTYTITIDGQTTAAIAYNAANATILAALNALPNISSGDVVLTGGGAAGVSTGALTLTFGGDFAGRAFLITTDSTSLTGGGTYDAGIVTAGVETAGTGIAKIEGFIWPDALLLAAGGEVIGQVLIEGTVHRDDVPLNGLSQAVVDAGLKDTELRRLGIIIEGLTGAA